MKDLPIGRVPEADPAKVLEVFALIPDKDWGLRYAAKVPGDCPLGGQSEWLGSQYMASTGDGMGEDQTVIELLDARRRRPPPKLDWSCSDRNCLCTPVFLQCFPGQFDPFFSRPGVWNPVEPEKK